MPTHAATPLPGPAGPRLAGLEGVGPELATGAPLCAAPCCRAPARETPREVCAELWFVCEGGHVNACGLNEWKEAS